MTQGESSVILATEHEYLSRMSNDMTDMMFVFSNWGDTSLDWLQHGVCEGNCDRNSTISSFSNVKIWTSGYYPAPTEPVEPIDVFYYSYFCGIKMDKSLCDD